MAAARSRSRNNPGRTFVIDTSVLLSDPHALLRFDEHEVVIPVVVVTELEAKRTHPELGYFARSALRLLDDLRVSHGRLDEPKTECETKATFGGMPKRRISALAMRAISASSGAVGWSLTKVSVMNSV